MFQAIVFSFLAGLMGTNALPHLIKGLIGEEFPNLLGNSPLRNALAGLSGLLITAGFIVIADMPSRPWAAAISVAVGAYLMAIFHGLRGAYWLNDATGRRNPGERASQST